MVANVPFFIYLLLALLATVILLKKTDYKKKYISERKIHKEDSFSRNLNTKNRVIDSRVIICILSTDTDECYK